MNTKIKVFNVSYINATLVYVLLMLFPVLPTYYHYTGIARGNKTLNQIAEQLCLGENSILVDLH